MSELNDFQGLGGPLIDYDDESVEQLYIYHGTTVWDACHVLITQGLSTMVHESNTFRGHIMICYSQATVTRMYKHSDETLP